MLFDFLNLGRELGEGKASSFTLVFGCVIINFIMAYVENPEKDILNKLFGTEEEYPVVELKEGEVPKEIETYLEKIEKEHYLTRPLTDDSGRALASPPAPQQPKIVLPITRKAFLWGLHRPVVDSIRWLAEWIKRLLKIFPGQIAFKEAKDAK